MGLTEDLNVDELKNIEQDLKNLQWISYGVIAPIIIAVGVFGNIANLLVLSRPNLKSVTYVYLMWLAITDLLGQIFIIPSLLNLTDAQPASQSRTSAFYHAHIELALINGLMAASVFLVVAVTVDRYVSISRPTKFKKIHTYRRARINILVACIAATILNMPMCFYKRVEIREQVDPLEPQVNKTLYNVKLNSQVVTTAGWRVYLWTKEILTRLAPAVLLATLNFIIIRRFLQLVEKRRQRLKVGYRPVVKSATCSGSSSVQNSPLTSAGPVSVLSSGAADKASNSTDNCQSQSHSSSSGSFNEEKRLVMLLAGIVVMFFVAMTPAAFLSLYNSDDKSKNYYFQMFRAFANDMEFLNYAMNFYVYCLCSSEIRRTFVQIMTCRKNGLIPNQPMASTQQQQNNGFSDDNCLGKPSTT
ncbi:hypothetical protein CHUAL_013786 [Chamberlinius hualienensis]